MKKVFVVRELQRIERKKENEKHVIYKAIMLDEATECKMVLSSEQPLELNNKDEVELQTIKYQKQLKE